MKKKLNEYLKKESSINSNCGVFGIYNNPEAAILTYYGLHSLQHRGQEAAGIVTSEFLESENRHRFNIHKDHGLVSNVFRDEKILTDALRGTAAIGHTRYSTTGASDKRTNIQPFKVIFKGGNLALSHNGNLTNTRELRNHLQDEGTLFQTSTDSELLLHLIARSKKESIEEKILEAVSFIKGAYSICILTDDKLFAIRDPYGVRPFCMGKLGESFVFASETCALDIINADYVRDVMPGEMITIDKDVIKSGEPKSVYFEKVERYRHCIFEFIYFSRPDSIVFEEKVDKVRRRIGKNLALESPPPKKEDDRKRVVVINVPDSSNTATLGYFSEAAKHNSDIKNEIGLIRSHYVGRTFIQPGQDKREMKVRTKFNIVKGVLSDRKVVMIDDSIVRGTTSKLLVDLLKKASPKEIHLKITSPPIISPCYYGMDFPSKQELIAARKDKNLEEIKEWLGVDSIAYLSEEKLLESATNTRPETGFCTACFSGNYPIQIEGIDEIPKNGFDD
ncbi:MAG: amidophosphoribosyltransferase [Bacteroidetes bacterium]|nr:amidophosphoribosyltransferase [Bacteroidota bacterium]